MKSWTTCSKADRENSGGPGSSISRFTLKTAPLSAQATPARTRGGVSRFRQPKVSDGPQSPHDDPAGIPAVVGSSS